MTTHSYIRPALLGAVVALATGCGLLDTQTPDIIQPGNVESPEGADVVLVRLADDGGAVRRRLRQRREDRHFVP